MYHKLNPAFLLPLLFQVITFSILSISVVNAADIDVVWTNEYGVTISGNSLTKTTSYGESNSGAFSTRSYGGDFAVEFDTLSTSHTYMLGISDADVNLHWNTIDFGMYLWSGGIYINENGTFRYGPESYTAGDVLKIDRTGTTITYRKNDTTFYTSTVSSTGTLFVDATLVSNGATISNVRFTDVNPDVPDAITDLNTIPDDGSIDLTWTAPSDNAATITEYEVQYGTVTSGTFGSTYADDASPGATISSLTNDEAYQFRVIAKNSIGSGDPSNEVRETAGERTAIVWKDVVGLSITGTLLTKTAATGWDNAGAFSTTSYGGDVGVEFPRGPDYDYMVGFSLINVDNDWDTIDFAINVKDTTMYVIENGDYSNFNTTAAQGDVFQIKRSGTTVKYYKNHEAVYTSTVPGIGSLSVDMSSYWQNSTVSDVRLMNVANYSPTVPGHIIDLTVEPIDGGVNLDWTAPGDSGAPISEYEIQYGTITSGTFASTYTDNAFPGATVTGLTNDVAYQFRVVATNPIGTGNPSNVAYETPGTRTDVVWTNLSGVNLSGTTLTRTNPTNWVSDAGAISATSYGGDVALDIPRTEQWEHVVGFTYSNANHLWAPMDYSFYISENDVYVVENSTSKYQTSIAEGDSLQIKRSGTTVKYYKNHQLIYTSLTSSSGYLYVDTWMYWLGGKVSDIELFNISGVPEITNVSHSPAQIDPAASETTTIQYTLAEDADVTIDIYEASYNPVNYSYSQTYEDTVLSADSQSAGSHTFVWDGKDSSNNTLSDGAYTYLITATGTIAGYTYDPTYFQGLVAVSNATFTPSSIDPYRGEVATASFDLAAPAWVYSAIGIEVPGESANRILLNWVPLPSGTHTVLWDGRDDNGDFLPQFINIYAPQNNDHYNLYHWTRVLPVNGVVIKSNDSLAVNQAYADPIAFYPKYDEVTEITYGISVAADVTVTVLDSQGGSVRVLVNDESKSAGNHTIEWDGKDDSGDTVSDTGIFTIQVEATQGETTATFVGTVSVF